MSETRRARTMTDAARRHSTDADASESVPLDVAELQALAGGGIGASPTSSKASARRGPFRPAAWLNARQRHASRLAAHYFRAFDVLAVASLSLLCAWAAAGPLFDADVAAVLPFALGAVVILALMRSLGQYRF